MLSDFIDRGTRAIEEWERVVAEENNIFLADKLLEQIVRINHTIASIRALTINDLALKSSYIQLVAIGKPSPDIGPVEWGLIDSLLEDISRLSESQSPVHEHVHSR